MPAESPAIRAFLSYSHADEAEFGLVDPLISKLRTFVRGKSGRELEVFVDRDSIGWGVDWRSAISSSVDNATVFLPLLSANYLDSDACREEFLAFHSKAEVSGVTELLLPVLVLSSSLFGPDSSDDVARIAEALQYKCIEEPLLAGFQSSEWLRCTKDLAESLLAAVSTAESALGSDAAAGAQDTAPADPGADPTDPTDTDVPGLTEVLAAIESAVERMSAAAEGLAPALEDLGSVAEAAGTPPDTPTAKQMNAWTLALAQGFKEPALRLERLGREVFEATKEMDECLLHLAALIESVGAENDEFAASLREGRDGLVDTLGDLRETAESMDELLVNLRPAEALSLPLRKALRPARRGVTAVRDSLRLIDGWRGA